MTNEPATEAIVDAALELGGRGAAVGGTG
jgi:hypothetical protein